VSLFVGRQPDFIVGVGLLKYKACSLLQVCDHATSEAKIADEVGFEPRDVVRFFVNPDYAGKFVDDFFGELVGLEFGIRLEIEDKDVLAAKTFAARIDKLSGAEKGFDADVLILFVFIFIFAFLFLLFFLRVFFRFVFLDVFDGLLRLLVFFLLLLVAERLAVLLD